MDCAPEARSPVFAWNLPVSPFSLQPFEHNPHLNSQMPRVARRVSKEKVMFAATELSQRTRRVVCMLMAVMVVAASLSLGAIGAESPFHPGYSVTVTEVQ